MKNQCLSKSRFIAFFDECGDHSLVKVNPEMPVFCLCTVIVEREYYARTIIPAFAELKLRFFDHEGITLHSREIRRAAGRFLILQDPQIRRIFLTHLNELIISLHFTLFVTVIKKKDYLERFGNTAKNPYDLALEFTFERILHFMEAENETELPVIAEARGKNEDYTLRAGFQKLMTEGTRHHCFRKLNCPLSFHDKHRNIAGIQLADLCAHPVARKIITPSGENRAYDIIHPHFYQLENVYGLKIFPK